VTTSMYPVWLLNYYREAEVRSADLLQRLLRHTDNPELQIAVTRQLADEARHMQIWTELLSELGEPLVSMKKGYRYYLHTYAGMPTNVLHLLTLVYVVEERVQQRYREHLVQVGEGAHLVEMLRTLAADEEWHVQGVRGWLAKLEKQQGRTRVAAALDYYRSAEASAYADLIGAAQEHVSLLAKTPSC
jgi:rubrerythrin